MCGSRALSWVLSEANMCIVIDNDSLVTNNQTALWQRAMKENLILLFFPLPNVETEIDFCLSSERMRAGKCNMLNYLGKRSLKGQFFNIYDIWNYWSRSPLLVGDPFLHTYILTHKSSSIWKVLMLIWKHLHSFYTLFFCALARECVQLWQFYFWRGDEREREQNKIMFTHVSVIVDVISKVSSNCSVLQNQLSSPQRFVWQTSANTLSNQFCYLFLYLFNT